MPKTASGIRPIAAAAAISAALWLSGCASQPPFQAWAVDAPENTKAVEGVLTGLDVTFKRNNPGVSDATGGTSLAMGGAGGVALGFFALLSDTRTYEAHVSLRESGMDADNEYVLQDAPKTFPVKVGDRVRITWRAGDKWQITLVDAPIPAAAPDV